jgi:hypothetical protein
MFEGDDEEGGEDLGIVGQTSVTSAVIEPVDDVYIEAMQAFVSVVEADGDKMAELIIRPDEGDPVTVLLDWQQAASLATMLSEALNGILGKDVRLLEPREDDDDDWGATA